MAVEPHGAVPSGVRAAAAYYLRLGYLPVPVPRRGGGKAPVLDGWQQLRPTVAALDDLFPDDASLNLGLLLGRPSHGLVDIDLDCADAVAAAPFFLPPTGWVSGRQSRPKSHWWYTTDAPPDHASQEFPDLDGTMLLEVRSTGAQTIVPPSVHECDEAIVWHRFDQPARVATADLQTAAREVAAVALLARHWPWQGSRQRAFMALSGGLLRAGWDVARAERFLTALAAVTRDEEARKRVQNVVQSAGKLEQGEKVTGWPKLAATLGEHGKAIIDLVRTWLGIAVPAPARVGSVGSVGSVGARACYRPLPPFRPFPRHALPPVLGDLAYTAADSIGCDPALIAAPALAVAAGCVGNARAVVLKKGWSEPAVLWSVTVAESGGHKSPAYHAAVDPLMELQLDLFDRHQEELEAYKDALNDWAALSKDERGPKPLPPVEPPVFITSDTTVEALGELLRDNAHGVLMARDELDAWFQSFTRYKGKGGGTDRAQWLEMHRAGTQRLDRLTREQRRLSVRRAAVSVTGTIQPGVLARALDQDALQAGLGARFLITMPPRRRRVWTEKELPDDLVVRYQRLLRELLALPLDNPRKRKPLFLGLSEPARRLWIAFYNEWGEVQYQATGEQAAAFAKLEAYAPRLMLLHHVVAHAAAGADGRGAVGEASARAGIELAQWFAAEAVRVYAMLRESEEERETRKLMEWIAAHGGRVSVRQLQNSNSRKLPSSDLAEAALQEMVAHSLGRWEESAPPGGGHATRWFVLIIPTDTSDTRPVELAGPRDGASDTRTDGRVDDPGHAPSGLALTAWGSGPCDQKGLGGGGRVSEVSDVGTDIRPASGPASPGGGARQVSEASVGRGAVGSGAQHDYEVITDPAELSIVMTALEQTRFVGLDIETTGLDPRAERVRLLSLDCDTTDDGRFTYLIDAFAVDPTPLFAALAEKEVIAHNAAFDLAFLARLGFEPGTVHDTMLASQLFYGPRQPKGFFTLAASVGRELCRPLDKAEQKSNWSGPLTSEQFRYAAEDAAVLLPLHTALTAKLKDAGLDRVAEVERRCLPTMAWVGGAGVAFDRATWQALVADASAEAQALREALDELAPQPAQDGLFEAGWNWDSTDQVRQAFGALGIALDKTDDDTLAKVEHQLAQTLRAYRVARKQVGTYGQDWLQHVASDCRVYSRWRQIGAITGRMANAAPNLQNVPRALAYRRCFIAPPGRVLLKADLNQIELRVAARVTGEAKMLAAYAQGQDLHTLTARTILGKEQVSKEERRLAKPINFVLIYGLGSDALRRKVKADAGIDLSVEQAEQYRRAFFQTYPAIRAWNRRIKAEKATEVRTLAGRRCAVAADGFYGLKANYVIQGTAGDGFKAALGLLWERRHEAPGAVPVAVVHDEVLLECDAEQAEAASAWLRRALVDGMAPLIDPVPVEVEVQAACTWGG
jgi:DNA polymerase I-like protein with 3'-5' exonuclease and polymerase domains